ncbi:MAG: glutathione S-transferase [Woeseiaceae bacterium]|jgi:glutathione S-transferase
MSNSKLKVYGDSKSGNCYKIQLLCSEMQIGYEWQEVDLMAGDTRTAEFLAMNRNGKIPLLALPDGRYLAESNAILCFLADGSEFFAGDAFARAEILQWLFFEQYSHEPNIATSRFIIRYLGNPPDKQAALEEKKAGGYKALEVMEQHLSVNDYFAGGEFSIADIALFAYTHIANEGGFDLDPYVAIHNWIGRVKARANYMEMKST